MQRIRRAAKLTCPSRSITLREFINRQNRALLPRLVHPRLHDLRPLLQCLPIHKHDVASACHELDPAVLLHEERQIFDVLGGKATVDGFVVEEGRVEVDEGEAEDAVVAGIGEEEGGPFG